MATSARYAFGPYRPVKPELSISRRNGCHVSKFAATTRSLGFCFSPSQCRDTAESCVLRDMRPLMLPVPKGHPRLTMRFRALSETFSERGGDSPDRQRSGQSTVAARPDSPEHPPAAFPTAAVAEHCSNCPSKLSCRDFNGKSMQAA